MEELVGRSGARIAQKKPEDCTYFPVELAGFSISWKQHGQSRWKAIHSTVSHPSSTPSIKSNHSSAGANSPFSVNTHFYFTERAKGVGFASFRSFTATRIIGMEVSNHKENSQQNDSSLFGLPTSVLPVNLFSSDSQMVIWPEVERHYSCA